MSQTQSENLPPFVELIHPVDGKSGNAAQIALVGARLCTIEHPLDKNKILLFCGHGDVRNKFGISVYCFDINNHILTFLGGNEENSRHITCPTVMPLELNESINYNLDTNTYSIDDARLVITGATSNDLTFIFHVYNVTQNEWESMSCIKRTSVGKGDFEFISGCRMISYKEYIIMSGGRNQYDSFSRLLIYRVEPVRDNCDYNYNSGSGKSNSIPTKFYPSKAIAEFDLPSSYQHHAMLKIPNTYTSNASINIDTVNEKEIDHDQDDDYDYDYDQSKRISLIIFGGERSKFEESLSKVEIRFNSSHKLKQDNNNGNGGNGGNGCQSNYSLPIITCKITDEPPEWIDNIPKSIKRRTFEKCYYHIIQSQYLIIFRNKYTFGATVDTPNKVVVYDINSTQWKLCENILPNLAASPSHSSIICNQDRHLYIFTMSSSFAVQAKCIKVKLTKKIDWLRERVIWIAFYQNMKNEKCLIKNLPKDVIIVILDFVGDLTILSYQNKVVKR